MPPASIPGTAIVCSGIVGEIDDAGLDLEFIIHPPTIEEDASICELKQVRVKGQACKSMREV